MLELVVVLAYVSYFVEILIFPVPSVASAYQLMRSGGKSASASTWVAERKSLPWWRRVLVFVLPTLVGIVLFAIPPILVAYPTAWKWLHPIPGLSAPGLAPAAALCIVAGRFWTFRSVIHMRGGFREPFRPIATQPLRSQRSFSRSRNPGLLGMYVFYFGLVLGFPSFELLAGFPLYVLNMHYRVLLEESDLSVRFGDDFQTYRQSTARYF